MLKKYDFLMGAVLMTADLTTAGGDAALVSEPSASDPVEPVVADPVEPVASVPTPNVFDRAKALMKSKPSLQAALTQSQAELSALTVAHTQVTAERDEAVVQLAALTQSTADLEAHVSQLETEATTVQAGVVDQIAQLGVPEVDLPNQAVGEVETLEGVRAKIRATSDPAEKAKLVKQARDLRRSR